MEKVEYSQYSAIFFIPHSGAFKLQDVRFIVFPMGGFPTFCVIATENNN